MLATSRRVVEHERLESIRAIRILLIARTRKNGGTRMQTTPKPLRPAQAEVHRTAHDQDLIEVPRRATLDREAESKKGQQPSPARAKE